MKINIIPNDQRDHLKKGGGFASGHAYKLQACPFRGNPLVLEFPASSH
jgi:hypothetical protein